MTTPTQFLAMIEYQSNIPSKNNSSNNRIEQHEKETIYRRTEGLHRKREVKIPVIGWCREDAEQWAASLYVFL